MSFNCYDLAGKKITTASYLDCNPSLDITMTASEFAALKNAIANAGNSNLTVAELFAVPAVPDLQTVFMAGFALPLILYLVAWAYGVVLNFINEK
jgi:hypothetical protein